MLNDFLISLLLRIHKHELDGENYAYDCNSFSDVQDAVKEEDGLFELRDMGYIEIISLENHIPSIKTKYVNIIVKNITYRGNNFIREHLAKENLRPLEETIRIVPDIYQQARSHLAQARKHIFSIDDARSRKDALRDCLSAMEALIKQVSEKNDIKLGTQHLRDNVCGPNIIVKDGLSIWNQIHNLYADIRHGDSTPTDLPQAEALYWIERILTFINYLSRIKKA